MEWLNALDSVCSPGASGLDPASRSDGCAADSCPDIKPDLLLILLVFFGSRCSSTDGVITSFAIGFVADLVSPIRGVMGPRIISFGLFGTLLSDVQNVFSLRRPLYQGGAIFLVGVLTAVLSYLLASLRAEGGHTSLSGPVPLAAFVLRNPGTAFLLAGGLVDAYE